MAKTYVVKLEIDGVSESITSINQLEGAVSELESQLKSADLGSAEFKKLSKELGNAKKELNVFQRDIDALDPTAKAEQFVKFGEGIAGGFAIATGAAALLGLENETLEKTMVQAQGAIAIAVGFRSLAESKLIETIGKSIIADKARAVATGVSAFVTGAATKGVKLFRLALASTGIGAIVVAIGLLVAYWDDIKGLVSGVTGEQKKLNEEAEENLRIQKEALEAISAQENSLKLQGKTDREIRDLKIQQTNEIITATELQLEQMQLTKKAQIEAAKRNTDIAQGIIAFMTIPITSLLVAVDALTYGLSLTGILDEGTSLADDFTGGAADLLFDAEGIETKADEAIKTTLAQLTKLKNSRDGFLLQTKSEDEARAQELKDTTAADEKTATDQADTDLDATLKRQADEWQQIQDLTNELALMAIESDYERAQEQLIQQEIADLNAINGAENFFEQKLLIEEKYKKLSNDLLKDKLKKEKEIEDEAKAYKEKELKEGIDNLQNILSVGGKNMQKVGKALAIADVVRTSVKSVSEQVSSLGVANAKSVAASPLTGGMPFVAFNTLKAGLSIGSTLASAAKSIQAIKGDSTSVPSSSGAGGGGGGGGGTPNLGTPEETANIDFSFLGDGDVSEVGQTAPVQAYVIGSDVTSSQEASQVIKDQSTL